MNKVIHLTDNYYEGTPILKENLSDVLRIASIGKLHNAEDMLVFPHSFSDLEDGIENLSILTLKDCEYENGKCVSAKACTGNLMGFVGVNETSISIHSRFTHDKHNGVVEDTGKDYFLYYMLQKVFSINVFEFEHTSNQDDKILDFMLYLFPYMLNKALVQGMYKEYQCHYYDDSRVKGVIEVSKYLRNDVPFRGNVSCRMREFCFDNPMTQLIRHTIDYIKHHPYGAFILNSNQETWDNVNKIIQVTSSFNKRDLGKVINANRKPKVHPYFIAYKELQLLCMRILCHDSLKYGENKDKIHGILFDGAWLWEEYLYTILKECGFRHPKNKTSKGGVRMFEKPEDEDYFDNNSRRMYPDFWKEDHILDAKYKHLNGKVGRDDLYQVVSYMHCMKTDNGGYVYPNDNNNKIKKYQLAGCGGQIYVIPFDVPQNADNWVDFSEKIKDSENVLKSIYYCPSRKN
ncbi:MAG: hypothetical protein Q4E55_04700 [Bacteroidales bacterium]|nr:hypothetical protein [Bacteroidales bacterium]